MLRFDEEAPTSGDRSPVRRRVPAMFVAVAVIGFLALGTIGFRAVFDRIEPLPTTTEAEHALVEIPIPAQTSEVDMGEELLNPFWHSQTQEELTEPLVQQYLYGMSKQKVIVPFYIVRYEMTPERIAWLSDGLDGRSDMTHADVYRAMLERWSAGGFTRAVEDHNTLYRLMDGETGEAERLATAEEEEQFIERFYR